MVRYSAADGDFCSATSGQTAFGVFGQAGAQYIEVNGMAPGDLSSGASLASIQSSVFCIPPSGDFLVDAVANLPGPGAVTLTGEYQLVMGSPGAAFLAEQLAGPSAVIDP